MTANNDNLITFSPFFMEQCVVRITFFFTVVRVVRPFTENIIMMIMIMMIGGNVFFVANHYIITKLFHYFPREQK